ncbi:MAG: hypothetical protein IT381_11935 [Deltaproteobacteria bacterium]|nr:hypothetical protein [Deltaproteobacteria bacterium]
MLTFIVICALADPASQPASQPAASIDFIGEAHRRLSEGDLYGAVRQLELGLYQDPKNTEARALLSSQLVRIGDELGAQGDHARQRLYYLRALELDPTLADKPSFQKRASTRDLLVDDPNAKLKLEDPALAAARIRDRRWFGFSVSGPGPLLVGVGLHTIPHRHIQLTLYWDAVALASLAGAFRVFILPSAWTPYISVGVRLPMVPILPTSNGYRYGNMMFEVGAQWMHKGGFFIDLSLTFGVPFIVDDRKNFVSVLPIPGVALGWMPKL